MRFTLIDRIEEIVPAESIQARKVLSLAEEYLADHFPLFPVMPGVLMLEAMTQASAWLIRVTDDFSHSMVLLKEARNVKYADFVKPGNLLTIYSQIIKSEGNLVKLKVRGEINGSVAVSARLVMEKTNLADSNPNHDRLDERVIMKLKQLYRLLDTNSDTVA